MTSRATEKTVIVVLGAPTDADGGPGPDLKHRLDRCLELAQRTNDDGGGPRPYVAVTGGNPPTYGSAGTVREGRCMRDYLAARGLDADRILVEDRAAHTLHNALYVKGLLRRRDLLPARAAPSSSSSSPPAQELTLVVLTTDWHAERSLRCFAAVFCDMPRVALQIETVPSDANDAAVKDRMIKEGRLIRQWLPRAIEEEADHRDMPPVADAMAACRNFSWHTHRGPVN